VGILSPPHPPLTGRNVLFWVLSRAELHATRGGRHDFRPTTTVPVVLPTNFRAPQANNAVGNGCAWSADTVIEIAEPLSSCAGSNVASGFGATCGVKVVNELPLGTYTVPPANERNAIVALVDAEAVIETESSPVVRSLGMTYFLF